MMSLALTPGDRLPVDPDFVRLRRPLEQALRGEDHLDLARADAERERPERAVGRRVGIAADDRHAGLRQAQLRSDDVDDPLVGRAEAVERDPELRAVLVELADLVGGHRVEDRQAARVGRGGVVGRGDRQLGPAHREAALAKPGERLRARDLVDQVQVDGEDGRRVGLLDDDVVVPDLLDEGSATRFNAGHLAACGDLVACGVRRLESVAEAPFDASRGAPRWLRGPVAPPVG